MFLKTLGIKLASSLTSLTINYKLGYGSFVDKTGIPFYHSGMINDMFSNVKYDEGYLFRHRLSLTENTTAFIRKVSISSF